MNLSTNYLEQECTGQMRKKDWRQGTPILPATIPVLFSRRQFRYDQELCVSYILLTQRNPITRYRGRIKVIAKFITICGINNNRICYKNNPYNIIVHIENSYLLPVKFRKHYTFWNPILENAIFKIPTQTTRRWKRYNV